MAIPGKDIAFPYQRAGDHPQYDGISWGATSRFREVLTVTDNDAQHNTLSASEILGGIVVHTSVTGGGTVTTDTAVAIIRDCKLLRDNQCIVVWYINDGNQTLTLAGGTDVTIADAGQTIAENESALLLFRRTSSTTVSVYTVGG